MRRDWFTMRKGPCGLVSAVSEHVLGQHEEGVEVILQLRGKMVIEVSARRIGWCALLFGVPVDGVTFIPAEMNATVPII